MTASSFASYSRYLLYPHQKPEMLSGELPSFSAYVHAASLEELQENYVKTFDIQAPCALEVGYILFGEDYKRGHFLVKMQELHRQAGLDCGTELPDFLPHVLALLLKLPSDEAAELAVKIVLPAVQKMIGQLAADNVYRPVMEAIYSSLRETYPAFEPSQTLPVYPRQHDGDGERSFPC